MKRYRIIRDSKIRILEYDVSPEGCCHISNEPHPTFITYHSEGRIGHRYASSSNLEDITMYPSTIKDAVKYHNRVFKDTLTVEEIEDIMSLCVLSQ